MSKLDEVAKLAGVSKSTVSRVINNRDTISSQTSKKVHEAMQALQFHAQELKQTPEGNAMLGLILPFGKQIQSHSFGIDILTGAEEKAFENDYMILIGNSNVGRETLLTANMINRGVEGLIVLSSGQQEHSHHLHTCGVPLVLIDQRLGHRRIGLVSPNKHFTHKERMKGYRYALMEKGIQLPENYEALEGNDRTIAVQLERMLEAEELPTALFVTSPGLLEEVIEILHKRSLRIPEDISIVTFDEAYVDLAGEYQDFFTSINQPGKMMGSMAVEILFRHWRNPELEHQEIVLPGKFTVRRSTRSLT
jgi:DNA-binding LacI/PurR family transcriptional regulator